MRKKTIVEEVLAQEETPWEERSFEEQTSTWQASLLKDGLSLDVRQWSPEEADTCESAYYMVLLDVDGNVVSKCFDLPSSEDATIFWQEVYDARRVYRRAQEALKVIVILAAEQEVQEEETSF